MTLIRRKAGAFTLLELLTVMAISAILLTIIAIPMIQSFNLTRAAQGFADNQDKARSLITKIENEVSNAAAVRDNTGAKGALAIHVPGLNGADERILLPNTKLDLYMPAQGNPAARVGTAFIDPTTGRVDPTLHSPKGDTNLPASTGDVVVRYFIALRDPFKPYNNPFVSFKTNAVGSPLWLGTQSGQDNLYVLYRAEVPTYVYKTIGGVPTRVVNSAFFIDASRVVGNDSPAVPVYDDPDFMDPNHNGDAFPAYTVAYPGDATSWGQIVQSWLANAKIVTEVSRFDMVMPLFNKSNEQVLFSGNTPQMVPLIRFQPNHVTSEPAKGQLAVRSGEETVNAQKIGADVFETQYGSWANVAMTVWPSVYPGSFTFGNGSSGAVRPAWNGGPAITTGFSAVGDLELFGGTVPLFNLTEYHDSTAKGETCPFSRAVEPGATVAPWNTNFIPVVPDPTSGKVQASFDVREFGDPAAAISYNNNVPTDDPANPGLLTGPALPPSDPAYQAGNWFTFTTVNERFNRLWNVWDTLFPAGMAPSKEGPQGVKRYIDLRIKNQGLSTTVGPLSPANQVGRAYITPGSEVIMGPDQTPGPNYGHLVRYSRVPNVDSISVGPNQYKINYVDKPEPDFSLFGLVANYDPFSYNSTDFVSAVLQPRYRAGYVELNSRYGEPIPQGYLTGGPPPVLNVVNIYATYRFQFTEPNDSVAVDYDTSQLMDVILSVRNYPQTTIPNPQMTTVRGSASVRNYLR